MKEDKDWKPVKLSERLEKVVMSHLTCEYEEKKKKFKSAASAVGTWEEFLQLIGLQNKQRWQAVEFSIQEGKIEVIHGVMEGTSILVISSAQGTVLGTFSESNGMERSGKRRIRIERLLGARAVRKVMG